MGLRLKAGVDPEILRNFGFVQGKEMFGKERWCGDGQGYAYQAEWYHKFLRFDEDTGEMGDFDNPDCKIAYTDPEFDIPMVHISFRIGERYNNDLYIDCAPKGTYHIGGSDLDIVTNTLFKLIQAGLLEEDE